MQHAYNKDLRQAADSELRQVSDKGQASGKEARHTFVTASQLRRGAIPVGTVAVLLGLWQLAVDIGWIARYMLPSPSDVLFALAGDMSLLAQHTLTTVHEAVVGLVIGVSIGFVLAVLMDACENVRLALKPLITFTQTIPTISIAPLLILWFGYGVAPKIILIALTTFFPVTINLVSGFASVDPDLVDLLRTMRARPWHIFWYAKLPAALDLFFSALKISATYAIVGAVISEWLGGVSGLGVYMTRVRKSFAYDKMFASIVVVCALSLVLTKLVDLLEHVSMPWKQAERKDR